jgi:hypothetical protein
MFYLEGGGGGGVTSLPSLLTGSFLLDSHTYAVLYVHSSYSPREKKCKQKYVAIKEHLQMRGRERRSFLFSQNKDKVSLNFKPTRDYSNFETVCSLTCSFNRKKEKKMNFLYI